jgi:sigma-B regulation protein RsbU (phosphoserine phosphatase)
VGGDFYRVEALDENTYAILMADVVGHGVSAALYAMQLRSLWEDGRDHLADPAKFLAWLSRRVEVLTDAEAGYFATAVHVVYRADTGDCAIGVAGHPPPLIVRADGSMVHPSPIGPGLGLLTEPVMVTDSTRLLPGDHLLLFTDGAFEVSNFAQEELGPEGFYELISATDLTHADQALGVIEEGLLRYSNDLSLPDDLTLIHVGRVA